MDNPNDNINSRGTPSASSPATPGKPRHKGVDGWLLLFCLSLTLFNPIGGLYLIVASYKGAYHLFAKFPHLIVITTIYAALTLVLISSSFYTGCKLFGVKAGAVNSAKKFLLWSLAYVIVIAVLPFFAGFPSTSAINAMMTLDAIGRVILGGTYVALWFGYLNKSERVRNTYQS
jgi:hypothetical protein